MLLEPLRHAAKSLDKEPCWKRSVVVLKGLIVLQEAK